MTYKENFNTIGKKGTIELGGLKIEVKILDYKYSYGHDRWQVTPVSGDGTIWVEKIAVD